MPFPRNRQPARRRRPRPQPAQPGRDGAQIVEEAGETLAAGQARGRAPPWCGPVPDRHRATQVRSTEPNSSARPCARIMPRGPEALMPAAVSIHCCERTAKPLSARASGGLRRAERNSERTASRCGASHFEPPHQHVEQALARRLFRHVAQILGEHGAIDGFDVRGDRSRAARRIRRAIAPAIRRPRRRCRQGRSARSVSRRAAPERPR